jgi:hypothetical protein
MKVQAKQQTAPQVFVPIELNLTFENQEELDRFYAIFNHTKIADFLDPYDEKANEIRLNIVKHTSKKHNEYWQELDKEIDRNGQN